MISWHASFTADHCDSVRDVRRQLSLSTNNIEKVANLGSLGQLQVLSLARNQIKKLEGFDEVGQTLKELWISYNLLEKLVGCTCPAVLDLHHIRTMILAAIMTCKE